MAYDGENYERLGLGARRLLALADYLETVPNEKYDQRVYRTDCHTCACALGHAATGLSEVTGLRWASPNRDQIIVVGDDLPSCLAHSNLSVAMRAFELTEDQVQAIFGAYAESLAFYGVGAAWDITPKRVAEKIRAFVYEEIAVAVRR